MCVEKSIQINHFKEEHELLLQKNSNLGVRSHIISTNNGEKSEVHNQNETQKVEGFENVGRLLRC